MIENEIYDVVSQSRCASRYLHEHGLFTESMLIDRLLKQRAELLEALKRFTAYGKVFAYRTADGCPYDQAMEAIEKCDQ